MGSFLEKYNASEWDEVADSTIYYLKIARKHLASQKNITNEEDINRMIAEVNKLIRDFKE